MKIARAAAATLLVVMAVAAPAAAAPSTVVLNVEGMTCAGCATAVTLVLRKTPGVADAKVSYEEKRAVVTYDPAVTTPQTIASAIAGALGYRVTISGPAAAVALAPYVASDLRTAFNRSRDRMRVVALLSPTRGPCQQSGQIVESVFSRYPVLAGIPAPQRAASDVYLLYAPGVEWTGDRPPAPTFSIRQPRAESGADQPACVNAAPFLDKVAALLRAWKQRA